MPSTSNRSKMQPQTWLNIYKKLHFIFQLPNPHLASSGLHGLVSRTEAGYKDLKIHVKTIFILTAGELSQQVTMSY